MPARGSALHLFALGERLHPLEWPLVYVVFPVLAFASAPPAVAAAMRANAAAQLALFVVLCQLPLWATGKLWYVDVAWPMGLVLIAARAAHGANPGEPTGLLACWLDWRTHPLLEQAGGRLGLIGVHGGKDAPAALILLGFAGWWVRRSIISAIGLLHGGRMALGALVLFGLKSKGTYVLREDLQRYRFAKERWYGVKGMPRRWWWLKAQHDTLQQCLANSCLLALVFLVPAANSSPHLAPLEAVGWLCWLAGFLLESAADVQKQMFVRETRRQGIKGGVGEAACCKAEQSHGRACGASGHLGSHVTRSWLARRCNTRTRPLGQGLFPMDLVPPSQL